MTINSWTTILFPIISALLASYLTYYWSKKSRIDEAILRYKEEKYGNLLVSIQGFVIGAVSLDKKQLFLDERSRASLYCSDEVSTALNELLHLAFRDNLKEEADIAYGKIVIAMRKDLGHKTNLNPEQFQFYFVSGD